MRAPQTLEKPWSAVSKAYPASTVTQVIKCKNVGGWAFYESETEKKKLKKILIITCCRQSWESAEVHPHLLPPHCDTEK